MNTNHYPSEHAPRHRAEQDEDPEHGMGDAFVLTWLTSAG